MNYDLDALLVDWEDRLRSGERVEPEDLCPNSPEAVEELRRRMRALSECNRLLGVKDAHLDEFPETPTHPRHIGPYEVRGCLGSGGTGVVYDGWDPLLNRPVALKMLGPLALVGSADRERLAKRFKQEGELLAKLLHPNIVPVYAAFLDEGQMCLVLEKMPGGSLAERLRDFSTIDTIVALMEKVAHALDFAHRNGVLHRDLKPGNILLDSRGTPRVSDFGLAKLVGNSVGPTDGTAADQLDTWPELQGFDLTSPGANPGTPPYMAPEQFDPATFGEIGPATDVWAMGVILYELLTGKRPFAGKERSAISREVCEGEPVRLRKQRARLNPRLEAIVERCLQKQPRQRYSSAGAVAEALSATRNSRWHWGVGLAAVGILAAAGWMALPTKAIPKASPEEEYQTAIRPVYDQLAQKEPIELIPQGRPPQAYYFREGGDSAKIMKQHDTGSFMLFHPYIAFLELLPHMPKDGFILHAELRHEYLYASDGRVGIYFAYYRDNKLEEPCHCFTMLGLIDPRVTEGDQLEREAEQNFFHVHQVCFSDARSSLRAHMSKVLRPYEIPAKSRGDWHTIRAKVQPNRVEVFCDDHRLGAFDHAKGETIYRKEGPTKLPGVTEENLQLPITGGLGIAVRGGTVSVRRLSVEPIEKQP
jgi:serine/threonine protein kinase